MHQPTDCYYSTSDDNSQIVSIVAMPAIEDTALVVPWYISLAWAYNTCMSEVKKVNQCVEALCESGCDTVRDAIESLENHQPVVLNHRLIEELDEQEQTILLAELVKIMAVYKERDC